MKGMQRYRLVRAGFLNESERNLPKSSADGRESGTATPIFARFPDYVLCLGTNPDDAREKTINTFHLLLLQHCLIVLP
jgi:hypothetical protein